MNRSISSSKTAFSGIFSTCSLVLTCQRSFAAIWQLTRHLVHSKWHSRFPSWTELTGASFLPKKSQFLSTEPSNSKEVCKYAMQVFTETPAFSVDQWMLWKIGTFRYFKCSVLNRTCWGKWAQFSIRNWLWFFKWARSSKSKSFRRWHVTVLLLFAVLTSSLRVLSITSAPLLPFLIFSRLLPFLSPFFCLLIAYKSSVFSLLTTHSPSCPSNKSNASNQSRIVLAEPRLIYASKRIRLFLIYSATETPVYSHFSCIQEEEEVDVFGDTHSIYIYNYDECWRGKLWKWHRPFSFFCCWALSRLPRLPLCSFLSWK